MIGAHPDDEDTELLTTLVRGLGTEAAYLSLNRGEGGQNLIGPELGEALGILRTEELLAARRLDGARQFFTRAYDFGFSKNLADTWAHWPQDSVLKDVVRIVRRFRPQVIVSIFSGTPRDGHGQHQAAGWAAQEVFRIAGDSTRFPELLSEEHLPAWTPQKLYRTTRFDTAGTSLRLDGGALDEAVGQTYHQIAMRGRSLHRSQDMGQLQGMGPSENRLMLWSDRTGMGQGGLFAGIDTSMSRVATALGGSAIGTDPLREPVDRYVELVAALQAPRSAFHEAEIAAQLRAAAIELAKAQRACTASADCARSALAVTLADQTMHLDRALFNATGILVDVLVDDERVVAGQSVGATLIARNVGNDTAYVCPQFGSDMVDGHAAPVRLVPGQATEWHGSIQPPTTTSLTQPYYLEHPRQGDLYNWPTPTADGLLGRPFERPPGAAVVLANGPGESCGPGAVAFRELSWRTNDQSRGEVRRPLWVVPRVDVAIDPIDLAWPLSPRTSRRFTVILTHGARDTTSGTVTLELPAGWAVPASRPFKLSHENERQELVFEVRPPVNAPPGPVEFRAVATDQAGVRYGTGQITVDYSHIRPRVYLRPAVARITLAAIVLPSVTRIGYIRGAADRVPEALLGAGLPVELLGHDVLERGDLTRYPVIVIGPRAYETDTSLVRNNARLLDYARQGGRVVVQYQQHIWFNGGFSPYAVTVGGQPLRLNADSAPGSAVRPAGLPVSHDRVTDETAPIRILDANAPVWLRPNRITPADWDGWIQERGLYFARSWDPAWKPLLETHDPGEAPLQGGLLVARLGKGTFVYTGLSFFRQLPAGVPGAFRLFANLLALGDQGGSTKGSREQ
jgi:hypothetical protein